MRTILFTLILLSTAILIPNTVYAQRQMQCVPYKEAISVIANDYNEVLLNRGLERNGASMIEVWANEDTGTFTIIRVMHIPVGSKPRKAICATISGEAWNKIVEKDRPVIEKKEEGDKT